MTNSEVKIPQGLALKLFRKAKLWVMSGEKWAERKALEEVIKEITEYINNQK